MKGILTTIPVEGAPVTREIAAPPTCDELQKLVGGWIEQVPYWSRYRLQECAVFCDEEGKLKGKPVNWRATALWYQANAGDGQIDDVLCGDIVIVCGDDELMENL